MAYFDRAFLLFFFFLPRLHLLCFYPSFSKYTFQNLHSDTKGLFETQISRQKLVYLTRPFCCQYHHHNEVLQLIGSQWSLKKIYISGIQRFPQHFSLSNSTNKLVNIKVSQSNTRDIYCTSSQKNNNNNNNDYPVMVRQIQSR